MRKLYEIFKVLKIQKITFSAEPNRRNTVSTNLSTLRLWQYRDSATPKHLQCVWDWVRITQKLSQDKSNFLSCKSSIFLRRFRFLTFTCDGSYEDA